jgi:hypothetical protein
MEDREAPHAKRGPNVWVIRYRGKYSVKEERRPGYLVPPVPQRIAVGVGRLLARINGSELIIQGPVDERPGARLGGTTGRDRRALYDRHAPSPVRERVDARCPQQNSRARRAGDLDEGVHGNAVTLGKDGAKGGPHRATRRRPEGHRGGPAAHGNEHVGVGRN